MPRGEGSGSLPHGCTLRSMSIAPAEQFRVEMSNGLVIERLPLGYAHDKWRLCFVTWGARSIWKSGRGSMIDRFEELISVEGVSGLLDRQGTGCGGSGEEQEYAISLRTDASTTGIRVSYHSKGRVVADELIDLPTMKG